MSEPTEAEAANELMRLARAIAAHPLVGTAAEVGEERFDFDRNLRPEYVERQSLVLGHLMGFWQLNLSDAGVAQQVA